jgi:hypothetical protein
VTVTFRTCGGTVPPPPSTIVPACADDHPDPYNGFVADGMVSSDVDQDVWITVVGTGAFLASDLNPANGYTTWSWSHQGGPTERGERLTGFDVITDGRVEGSWGPIPVGDPDVLDISPATRWSITNDFVAAQSATLTFVTSYWADAGHTQLLDEVTCSYLWDTSTINLELPPPSGDIVDIDAVWDATVHNPTPIHLTGLRFRLTVSAPGPVLTSDLEVLATGLTMTGAASGDDAVWTSSPFTIAPGGDFALHVTISHDDASTLSGTADLLGELLSAGDLVLASSTGTLTIEV